MNTPHHYLHNFSGQLDLLPALSLSWVMRLTFDSLIGAQPVKQDEWREITQLYQCGQMIARRLEQAPQPAYHNEGHVKEVLCAVVALWAAQQDFQAREGVPPLPAVEGVLLWLAMLGHDLEHPGCYVAPSDLAQHGRLEAESAQKVAGIMRAEGAAEHRIAQAVRLIEATEPYHAVPQSREAWRHMPCLDTLLPVLAAESDQLASVWPTTGPATGDRLADEWRKDGHLEAAHRVASWQGRLAFLRHAQWVSPAADQILDLTTWLDKERQLLEREAARWDCLPQAESRAGHLAAIQAWLQP